MAAWLKQLLCIHDWLVIRRRRFLVDEPDVEQCVNCGKKRTSW